MTLTILPSPTLDRTRSRTVPPMHRGDNAPVSADGVTSELGKPLALETNDAPVRGWMLGDFQSDDISRTMSRIQGLSYRAPRSDFARIPVEQGTDLAAEVRASNGNSRGTIIFVHGFCGDRNENGLFSSLSRCVSAAGFNSVAYDWRGMGESNGSFVATTLEDHVGDFRRVAEWSHERFDDKAPLYAVGFSLGAAVIGLSLRERSRLRQLAYLSPAVRPSESMWPRYDTPAIQKEVRARGVFRKPGAEQMVGRDMLHALRDTDLGPDAFDPGIPLLVCHGTGDTRVDCQHSRNLVASRQADRSFGYVEIEGASHSFRPGESHWDVLAATLVTWFTHGSDAEGIHAKDGRHEFVSARTSVR